MNQKDEIVSGESYSLEFKRVPDEEREKELARDVLDGTGSSALTLEALLKLFA